MAGWTAPIAFCFLNTHCAKENYNFWRILFVKNAHYLLIIRKKIDWMPIFGIFLFIYNTIYNIIYEVFQKFFFWNTLYDCCTNYGKMYWRCTEVQRPPQSQKPGQSSTQHPGTKNYVFPPNNFKYFARHPLPNNKV